MPKNTLSVEIDASCRNVFDIIHDYRRRLEWDTLLSKAELLDGAKAADVGVRSRCVGTWRSGLIPVETEYIQFDRGRVAAVKLTNSSILFENLAATIKHEPLGVDRSRVTYIYSIRTRSGFLRPLLDRLVGAALQRETRRRLHALRAYVESLGADSTGRTGLS